MIRRAFQKILDVYVISLIVAVLCGLSAIGGGFFALSIVKAYLVAKGKL